MPDAFDLMLGGTSGTGKAQSGDALDLMLGTSTPAKKKRVPASPARKQLSPVGKVLDLLQRGGYATGSFADALGKGLFDGKPDTWPELGQRFQEGLAAAKEGFAGRDPDGWQRLAHRLPESLDVKLPKAPANITPNMAPGAGGLGIALAQSLSGKRVPVRGTLGFVASVMSDPVNQVGLGAKVINPETGTATRQVLSYAGKGWEDLPGVAGKIAEAVDTKVVSALDSVSDLVRATPLGQWFVKKLSTRGAVADDAFADLTQQARLNAEYLVEKEVGKGVSREKALRKVVEETGIPADDILELIERPAETVTRELVQGDLGLTRAVKLTRGRSATDYTVRLGDTLTDVAERHGMSLDDILRLNPEIADPDVIRAGQSIRIATPDVPGQQTLFQPATSFSGTKANAGTMASNVAVPREPWWLRGAGKPAARQAASARLLDPTRDTAVLDQLAGQLVDEAAWMKAAFDDGLSPIDPGRFLERAELLQRVRNSGDPEAVVTALRGASEEYAKALGISGDIMGDQLKALGFGGIGRAAPAPVATTAAEATQFRLSESAPLAGTIGERQPGAARELEQQGLFGGTAQAISDTKGYLHVDEPVPGGQTISQYEEKVSRLTDKPQAAVDLVKQYGAENAERLGIERAAGIDTPALDSDVLEYMHRHRTPEAVKAARKAGVQWRPMLDTTVQHGATKQRELLKDLSIKQINDLAQKGALDSVIPGFRGKLYEDNPALVQTLRDVMSAKALAASEFLDSVIKNPEWATAGEAPAAWAELSEKAVQNRFGSKVKGVKFRPDIAEALQKYVRDEFDPKQVDGFWKVYDKALGVWKEFTLGMSPSWIKNNVLGNTFNNYLQGVSPSEYARAAAIQNGRPLVIAAQSGKAYTAGQISELAGRLRVTDSGLYGADIRQTIEQQISGKGQNALQQTSFRANRAIENNARLANFIDGIRKGLSPENAAKRVNETLFDYGDLTDWEKNVAKRVMPFYTWYKKNAALQLEMMVTRPGKYTIIPKAADAIEYGQKERGELADKANLPSWLKDAYPVQVGTTPEGNVRYMTGRGVPALDVLKGPNELASANPVLTAIMQAALGYDPYLGRVIDKEPSSLLGIPMEQRYASAIQSLAPPLKNLNTMINPQDAPAWSTVEQPGPGERLKGLVFGKTYERDPGADAFYAAKDWTSQMREAQKALAQAEADGNAALVWWWRQRISELENQEPR